MILDQRSTIAIAVYCTVVGLSLAPLKQVRAAQPDISLAKSQMAVSLDGPSWLLAPDPKNVGRDQKWWEKPTPDAKKAVVPCQIDEFLPGYHGVAWYWRDFTPPANPHPQGRCLLRFWNVDYVGDVWVNGIHVGRHEGAQEPFVLDVTDAVKPQTRNRIAVRVLNPVNEPIDGIGLQDSVHSGKGYPIGGSGVTLNWGGIMDTVELIVAPMVRVENLFVRPNPKTGKIRVQANIRNAGKQTVSVHATLSVAPAGAGETLNAQQIDRVLPPGDTVIDTEISVDHPRLWDISHPYLYRVATRASVDGVAGFDEQTTRCGFRDFRFENGYFRLNGRRIFPKCSHTGADTPVGVIVARDPDLPRKDLLNCKTMGFNMIRFISGVSHRFQYDLCDEIGLLVYQENYACFSIAESPKMGERFDRSTLAMVKRDRNHPSVVMWGLLNEMTYGPQFLRAVAILPKLREFDDSRVVLLNSGSHDEYFTASFALDGRDGSPKQLTLRPGMSAEYAAVRWTAPADGQYTLSAVFSSPAPWGPTSDVHIYHKNKSIFDSYINLVGHGDKADFKGAVSAKKGDTIDAIVGMGNGNPFGDTTALDLNIRSANGKVFDVRKDFNPDVNPNGVWTYGVIPFAGPPNTSAFRPLGVGQPSLCKPFGRIANPGSQQWEDVLGDLHPYQDLAHNAAAIRTLRTINGANRPLWLSEYGIGSALDLVRIVRQFEQRGQASCEHAVVYRQLLDRFMADWQRWNLGDTFANPEDYFRQCLAWMADLRKLGTNAIRANPSVIGHSLTATQDPCFAGEGLTTTFRDLKPGVVDAMSDAWSPLRWCLFVEPVQLYRGQTARLEAVLANEDVLGPGSYPARLQVIGPNNVSVFDRTITVNVPVTKNGVEPPFALSVFAEDVKIDGPSGKYRFLATLQKGGAAGGGDVAFHVADPAEMPRIETEIVLWGDDPKLAGWLKNANIKTRPFTPGEQKSREVILVGGKPPTTAGQAFAELARHIAHGSHAVFLDFAVFENNGNTVYWLPLVNKGTQTWLPASLTHKDDWAKRHPIFDGLPAGGILDHTFYRGFSTNIGFNGQEALAEPVAGSINTSIGYGAFLQIGVFNLGAGRFTLNEWPICSNLGVDPVAERLLRNMLRYAASDLAKPVVALPANFDQQLKAMGY
jgi:hypothetical protein